MSEKIFVTRPYLPPLAKFNVYLRQIWKTKVVTNNGYFVKKLEDDLKKYFGAKHVFFVANGTLGLQMAIRALGLKKEIITTPFTYVATADSIIWEHAKPVFVDIDKNCCIDPKKIRAKITKNTQAILAVHVYGYPCDVKAIDQIAQEFNLKLIYDAAHAFGVEIYGRSIATFGDVSVFSFHATKPFHSAEGGAIVTNSNQIAQKIYHMRSFGQPEEDIKSLGINAKNSEIHAALGLCVLDQIETILEKRQKICDTYNKYLKYTKLKNPHNRLNFKSNYAYYPIICKSESQLLKIKRSLEANNIFPRRYFYPSINTLPFIKGDKCPISESIAKRVLCLPLYSKLALVDVKRISKIINLAFRQEQETSPHKQIRSEGNVYPFQEL